MKKITSHRLTGLIHCLSGLRVGGGDELISAGAADLTVIKHPLTLQPYLPGSSLKGKMRAELENRLDRTGYVFDRKEKEVTRNGQNAPCGCGQRTCLVCLVFGPHKNIDHDLGPSRLIVRDAPPHGPEPVTCEVKTESANNRLSGAAHDPRKIERVPAGTDFDLKLVIQVWDADQACRYDNYHGAEALVAFVRHGLRLVQDSGLGSGVSRGSGEVEFRQLQLDGAPLAL